MASSLPKELVLGMQRWRTSLSSRTFLRVREVRACKRALSVPNEWYKRYSPKKKENMLGLVIQEVLGRL